MFKEDTFSFTPIDELVLSMPFEFIRNLKVGIWTNIERSWLKKLQKHLTQADNTSIIHVRFIRKIVRDNRMKESQEYEDDVSEPGVYSKLDKGVGDGTHYITASFVKTNEKIKDQLLMQVKYFMDLMCANMFRYQS